MLTALHGITIALYVSVGAMSVWVGFLHARRATDRGPGARATRRFALFWIALAADALLAAGIILLAGLGGAPAAVATVATLALFLAISLMMWGLLSYLAFLFTGSERAVWPIAAFYGLAFAASIAFVVSQRPAGVALTRWGSQVVYASEPSAAAGLLLAVPFLIPPIVGALLYGSLFFRVRGATPRYRIALVSTGILVWFLTSLLLSGPGLADSDLAQGAGRAVTLAAILVVVLAYFPPRWVRERLGVERLSDEITSAHAPPDAGRRERLLERVRDLV